MPSARNSGPAIRLDAVSKRYGRTLALDGVNLEVRDKNLFALLGPNGAGKTTLMHILCTLLRPDAGKAFVAGVDVMRQPLQARRRLGIVFQEPSLDDRLSVHENLDLHGLVFGVPRKLRRQRIEELLALVELTDWADKTVRTLSSGMKRRLEIARALVHDSEILLLDEPTVGLDAQTRDRIWHYIRRLQTERAITVLVTTHYIEEVENCDQVCVIGPWQGSGRWRAGIAKTPILPTASAHRAQDRRRPYRDHHTLCRAAEKRRQNRNYTDLG